MYLLVPGNAADGAVVIHVDWVRACLWTAATNGPIVPLPDIWVWSTTVESYWHGNIKELKRKACHSATLFTTNPTWTDPGMNPGVCSERPATNRLSCGMACADAPAVMPYTVVRYCEQVQDALDAYLAISQASHNCVHSTNTDIKLLLVHRCPQHVCTNSSNDMSLLNVVELLHSCFLCRTSWVQISAWRRLSWLWFVMVFLSLSRWMPE
jgi:hypothetical protein